MSRLSKYDKALLEQMESEYGKEALADAIVAIAGGCVPGNEEPCCEPCQMKSPQEAVLDYIKKLEGFRIRLREIHWSADHNSTHKLSDDMISYLEDKEDEIAEDFMGIIGIRIKVGQIIPILPKAADFEGVIMEILNETYLLSACVEGCREFKGISNVLDDVIHDIYKDKYLETMA